MADKSISELVSASQVQAADLFVLEQGGTAKKLTGQILENWLVSFADGHGGIQSIEYTAPVSPSLVGSMLITLADTTTVTVPVNNGRSITGITWATSGTSGDGQTHTGTIAYNDGTTSTVTINDGVKGDTGAAWYVHIKYAGVEPTSDADMGDTPDNWMGIYSGTLETAPTSYTSYAWYKVKGEKGDKGDAATILSQSVSYMESESGTVTPDGNWSQTVPSVTPGNYLWTRTRVIYNTGDSVTSYSVSRYGIDGIGSVSTVNDVSPTSAGNVELTADNIPTDNNTSVQDCIDSYDADIGDLNDAVSSLEPLRPRQKHIILMGDSYALNTTSWTGWAQQFESITSFDVVAKSVVGGSGIIGQPGVSTVYQQLSAMTVTNPDEVTDILIVGGYNDASAMVYYSATENDFETALDTLSNYIKQRFRNATTHYGFIAANEENTGFQNSLNNTAMMLKRRCTLAGIAFIPNAQFVLLNHDYILQGSDSNAKSHPNSDGTLAVARFLNEYLASGYSDVKYGFNYGSVSFYATNGELTAFPDSYSFTSILPAMTYPFNTWTTIADLSGTSTNLLWGTHNANTCYKFWAAVYTNAGTFLTHALFRVFDKKIQVNPLNSPNGMTLTGTSWICMEGFTAPFEAMYG